MATLAFTVGGDIFLFDGKYTHAVAWVGSSLLHVFRVI